MKRVPHQAFPSQESRRSHCTAFLDDKSRNPVPVPADIPRCIDRTSHIGKLLPISSPQSCSKCCSHVEGPCSTGCLPYTSLKTPNARVPCAVLQSGLPKPWHPPESRVKLMVQVVFPLKTWEVVSWDLGAAVGPALVVCGVDPLSPRAIFSTALDLGYC